MHDPESDRLSSEGATPADWSAVSAPRGWEGVADVCAKVAADLPVLVERVIDGMEREIPDYRERASISDDDLRRSVRDDVDMMLLAIAEYREPRAEELEGRRQLGRQRASQGIGVDAVLEAYHVLYREVWAALVRETTNVHPEQAGLLTAATTVWTWVHRVTHAVAEAHRETTRGREALVMVVGQRFLDFLAFGDLASEEVAEAAGLLGFRPEGDFRIVCIRDPAAGPSELGRLQSILLRQAGGTARCAPRGQDIVVLTQGARLEQIEEALRDTYPNAAMGVGLARPGLPGARLSLGDAQRALALSGRRGGSRRFEADWIEATVLQAWDRLHPLLDGPIEVADQNPHLAATVRAFADAGFSIADTARRLIVHPNTVTYRLDRWRQLTGWNPRSYVGLAASMAALELGMTPSTGPSGQTDQVTDKRR